MKKKSSKDNGVPRSKAAGRSTPAAGEDAERSAPPSRGTPPLRKWDCVVVTPAQRSLIESTANMMHRQTCIPADFTKTILYDGSTVLDSVDFKYNAGSGYEWNTLPFHVFMRRLKVTVAVALGIGAKPTKEAARPRAVAKRSGAKPGASRATPNKNKK